MMSGTLTEIKPLSIVFDSLSPILFVKSLFGDFSAQNEVYSYRLLNWT